MLETAALETVLDKKYSFIHSHLNVRIGSYLLKRVELRALFEKLQATKTFLCQDE